MMMGLVYGIGLILGNNLIINRQVNKQKRARLLQLPAQQLLTDHLISLKTLKVLILISKPSHRLRLYETRMQGVCYCMKHECKGKGKGQHAAVLVSSSSPSHHHIIITIIIITIITIIIIIPITLSSPSSSSSSSSSSSHIVIVITHRHRHRHCIMYKPTCTTVVSSNQQAGLVWASTYEPSKMTYHHNLVNHKSGCGGVVVVVVVVVVVAVGGGGQDSVPSVRANRPFSRGNTTASCCQGQPPVQLNEDRV